MSLPRSRAAAAVAAAVVVLAFAGATPPAAVAHDDPGRTDAQHAADDLAGVPMSTIERNTKANQDRIAKQTGVRPGRRSATAQKLAAQVAAAADPGVAGTFGAVHATPVVPVFTAMLPNGKVLMWDSVGDNAAEHYPNHTYTRAAVWNPANNTYKTVNVAGYNIFCAGFAQLSDGNVLVAGGNRDQALHGLRTTFIFDWRTETWARGPDMAAERWYPSVTALSNHEALILGGGPATPEIYQTNKWMRLLTGIFAPPNRLYPLLTVRPDGKVDLVGPGPQIMTLSTSGAGDDGTQTTTRDTINRDYASFATIRPGTTMVAGGGIIDEGGQTKVPTKTVKLVNSNTSPPSVTDAAPMANARRQFNLSVLADGNALATGGAYSGAVSSTVDLSHPVFAAELYNAATNTWTTLASANRVRQYHSTGILLPDGRVMTGGGGICAVCETTGYLEKNIEYFNPPYLYKKDGTGGLAPRPAISNPPASPGYNTTFTVTTSSTIQKVGLVKLGAPTHGDDQGQRYVPLTYTKSGSNLTIRTPANANLAPPGYYMLFVTNSAGTPSVAKFVKLTSTVPTPPAAVHQTVSSPGNRCLDVDHGSTTPGAIIQAWDCNGSVSQRWSRPSETLKATNLNVCAGVPYGATQPGVRLQTVTCSTTDTAQKWTINSDGTIRSKKNPNVCLSVPGKANAERVTLDNCNGSAAQKWRY
jgi:Galactose oxidase-like, Early set domain/Ricin-type beta-trefoil lectin domain